MNQIISLLLSRRSIRKYKPEQINRDELDTIVTAGLFAMSGMNDQSCHLVVLQDKAKINKLIDICKTVLGAQSNPYYDAPTIILAFAKKDACSPIQDASLAIGNMAIAAASLNIGSCWINRPKDLDNTKEGKAFFESLFDCSDYYAVGSLAIGYPDETPTAQKRKENRVTYY